MIARGEADVPTSTISGNVGVSGATIAYSDGGVVETDSDGTYSISVPIGWSGTVTPSHACYTFAPSRTYSNVTSDQSAQDYSPADNSSGCADVDVYVGGGSPIGSYAIPSNARIAALRPQRGTGAGGEQQRTTDLHKPAGDLQEQLQLDRGLPGEPVDDRILVHFTG